MSGHSKKNKLPDMVLRIADEMNMLSAIDDMDTSQNHLINDNNFNNEISSIYYVSATLDAHREKAHIHRILERKDLSFVKQPVTDISMNKRLTVICLWDDLYHSDINCHAEFEYFVKMSKQYPDQSRIVIILLRPDMDVSGQISKDFICLPGYDRVSRELAIFKIVQEV